MRCCIFRKTLAAIIAKTGHACSSAESVELCTGSSDPGLVEALLFPCNSGTDLLGYQPSHEASGYCSGEQAVCCQELHVLPGSCQGDDHALTLHPSLTPPPPSPPPPPPLPPTKPLLVAGTTLVYPGPPTTHAYWQRLFFCFLTMLAIAAHPTCIHCCNAASFSRDIRTIECTSIYVGRTTVCSRSRCASLLLPPV